MGNAIVEGRSELGEGVGITRVPVIVWRPIPVDVGKGGRGVGEIKKKTGNKRKRKNPGDN